MKTEISKEKWEGLDLDGDTALVTEEEIEMVSCLLDCNDLCMQERAYEFIDQLAGMGDQYPLSEKQREWLHRLYEAYCG